MLAQMLAECNAYIGPRPFLSFQTPLPLNPSPHLTLPLPLPYPLPSVLLLCHSTLYSHPTFPPIPTHTP